MEKSFSKNSICANCSTTTTRMWRNIPNGDVVCNTCGLYYLAERKLPNPQIMTPNSPNASTFSLPSIEDLNLPKPKCGGPSKCNGTGGSVQCRGCPTLNQGNYQANGISCSNCGTASTPLWRRAPGNYNLYRRNRYIV